MTRVRDAVVAKPIEETRLDFPHDFGIFSDLENQNELFSLRLPVVGEAHASVSESGLEDGQILVQPIKIIRTCRHKASSVLRSDPLGIVGGK